MAINSRLIWFQFVPSAATNVDAIAILVYFIFMDARGRITIFKALRGEGLPSRDFDVKPTREELPSEGVEYLGIRVANIEPYDILNALGNTGLMAGKSKNSSNPALEYMGSHNNAELPGVYTAVFRDINHRK